MLHVIFFSSNIEKKTPNNVEVNVLSPYLLVGGTLCFISHKFTFIIILIDSNSFLQNLPEMLVRSHLPDPDLFIRRNPDCQYRSQSMLNL